MTDLTEQWKKGKLTEGFYYVNDGAEVTIDYYLCDYWERHFDSDVQQVLAPVPSFKKWEASENYIDYLYIDYLKQCISVYESKEKQHTDDAIAYNELAKENEELKEILERYKKATAKA